MGKEGKNEMKLIAKYLKPFALVVLLCLILLFGQAMCDLSLPNLMSDIVNVGIQQSGIEEGAPEAVSQKGMTLLKLMMDETDQKLMEDSYVSVDPQSSEAERFSEAYPLAHEEGICVLKTGLSEEELEAVDAAAGWEEWRAGRGGQTSRYDGATAGPGTKADGSTCRGNSPGAAFRHGKHSRRRAGLRYGEFLP